MIEEMRNPKPTRTVIWLVLFFPYGLYRMWSCKDYSPTIRWVVTGLIGVFIMVNYSSNYEKYKMQAKTQRSVTIANQFTEAKKNYQIDRLSREIQERIQKGNNPFDYAVSVEHRKWRNHDLLICNINGAKGTCGLFEVIEKDGEFKAYWINGVAKQKFGSELDRTPSSIDVSAAFRAATK